MFAQFTDSWVEDKVLFAYLSGGSCQCCGFIAAAPVNDLMSACTDLDTDDKRNHAQDESSWPINVREAVWSNRVEFRQQLKKDSSRYHEFWTTHSTSFLHFYHHLPIAQKLKLFQLHEKEVHQRITRAKFSDAYHLLLLTLLEQIQHFDLTMYPSETDAATPAEKMMVESLRFTRQTFVLHKTYHALEDSIQKSDTNTSDTNTATATATSPVNKLPYHPAGFLARFVELGSTKILPRLTKREVTERKGADDSDDNDDDDNVSEDGEPTTTSPTSGKQTQSFASDRRLLRILIFRAFADHVMRSFKKSLEQPTVAAGTGTGTATATATTTSPSVESITLQLPSLSIEVASPSSDRSQPPLSPSSLDLASPTANGLQLQTAPPPTSQSRPNSAGKRQHIHLVL